MLIQSVDFCEAWELKIMMLIEMCQQNINLLNCELKTWNNAYEFTQKNNV